ncbi:hypothetical protein LC724_31895 [Blautia sp. RD014234]|nr:hypothetical protein [Blautia parvula]
MEKILIVEDEEEIACGLSSLLKNQGYVCDGWDGRGNAVEIIRETAPDLDPDGYQSAGAGWICSVQGNQKCLLPACYLPHRPQHLHGRAGSTAKRRG